LVAGGYNRSRQSSDIDPGFRLALERQTNHCSRQEERRDSGIRSTMEESGFAPLGRLR
jgi:hypothetical protein